MTTSAGNLLRRAAEIVDGARNTQHGDKERSFACIADFWSVYLKHSGAKHIKREHDRYAIDGADVAAMQVLLKLARSLYGEPIEDHFIDMAGYSAILGELEAEPSDVKADKHGIIVDDEGRVVRCVGPDRDSS